MESVSELNEDIYSSAVRLRDLCQRLMNVHGAERSRIHAAIREGDPSDPSLPALQDKLDEVTRLYGIVSLDERAAATIIAHYPVQQHDTQLCVRVCICVFLFVCACVYVRLSAHGFFEGDDF